MKKNKGFIVIELIVVITVVGILSLLSTVLAKGIISESKVVKIRNDVKILEEIIQEELMNDYLNFVGYTLTSEEKDRVIQSCEIYNKKGEIGDSDFYGNLLKVSDSFVNKAGIKSNGFFFVEEGTYSKVFFCSESFEDKSKVKSATVSPYTLWNTDKVLKQIELMNLNTINLTVRVTAKDENASNMSLDQTDLENAVKLGKMLQEKDVNIILEPFLWINSGGTGETELNPNDVNSWFYNWENEVINPALKAFEDENVKLEFITVATNFVNLEDAHGYWTNLFSNIKEKYDVGITYRTNWWVTAEWDDSTMQEFNKKINNPMFKDNNLDVISVASYFELTEKENPTIDEMKDAIHSTTIHNRSQNIYKELKDISESNGKKIFFGELGTPNTKGFATHPWDNFYSDIKVPDAHYKYFKAYLDTFWKEDWIEGFSIFTIDDLNSPYNVVESDAIEYIRKLY